MGRSPRLLRVLEETRAALQQAERQRFCSERSRRWRLTVLRHRIQRLEEALGRGKPPVRRKPAYRIGEVARLLAVSHKTIHRWVARGRLRGWRTRGGHLRIPHRAVARLKKRRRRSESRDSGKFQTRPWGPLCHTLTTAGREEDAMSRDGDDRGHGRSQ